MYYVLLKGEKIVQVLTQNDPEVAYFADKLISDEIDNIIKASSIDELKEIVAAEFFTNSENQSEPEPEETVNELLAVTQDWWNEFAVNVEKCIDIAVQRVEDAGKKDLPTLYSQARTAGQSLLDEIRSLVKKK